MLRDKVMHIEVGNRTFGPWKPHRALAGLTALTLAIMVLLGLLAYLVTLKAIKPESPPDASHLRQAACPFEQVDPPRIDLYFIAQS